MHTPYWKCPVRSCDPAHTIYALASFLKETCIHLARISLTCILPLLQIGSPTRVHVTIKMYVSEGDGDLRDSVSGD